MPLPVLQRRVQLPFPIDVAATLSRVRRGSRDPCLAIGADGIWRASRSPGGPATVHLVPDGDVVVATAWGDGAEAALDVVDDLIGANDDDGGFDPDHRLLARLWRDHGRCRIPRTGAVTEALIASILEQRVTIFEAHRAQRQLVARWGEPAPGPTGLRLPPDPELLAGVAYYDLHVLGVERARADTVRRAAVNAATHEALRHIDHTEARLRLGAVPGIGRWTAAEVALVALGDPDAVPVGDAHLPNDVTYALTGVAVDDDEAMLEALAPFAGQRGRVLRLLSAAGIRAPRRAPRYAPRDIRRS